ncbi:MAG: TolC family outer membrane protein [Gammaproteobacteria bacterium]
MNDKLRKKLLAVLIGGQLAAPLSAQTLIEAVQETLKTNPDILNSAQERLAVDQELRQARAGYLPSVDLNAGIGRERSNNPFTAGSIALTRREAGISLSQMLFDGFVTPSEVDRQMARVNSRAYTLQSNAEDMALHAIEMYLNVLRRQYLVAAAEENLKAHERIHDQIKLRSDSGIGRKSDFEQAVGRLALAHSNLLAEETNLKDAAANYRRVVGQTPDHLYMPASLAAALPTSGDEALKIALANQPTLKAAEADVAATEAQHRAARATLYPRIDLEIGATDNKDVDGISGRNNDASAMLRLRYNLFNGGRDNARSEQTAYLINAAKDSRDRVQREVTESVQLSWNAYTVAKDQLEHLERHVNASEQARDAYRKQFDIGQRTLLDVLNTENEVFVSRTDYLNGKYTVAYAQYRILAIVGRLLESLNVALPKESAPIDTRK